MSTSNSSNIFAAGASSTPGSSNNVFANASAPSLFSNTASGSSQSAKPPSLFGQTNSLGSTNSEAPAAPASASSNSLFGTSFAGTASKPSSQSGSPFGAVKDGTTSAPSFGSFPTTGNSLFGVPPSTPSGLAPPKSPFSSLSAGNLFGSGTSGPSTTTTTGENPPSLFGAKPAAPAADTASLSSDKQTTGAQPPSLFGNPNTSSTSTMKPAFPVSNLFSSAQKKNEGEPQSSANTKLAPGEVAKDSKSGDKVDTDASKPDNKLGSIFSLGASKESSVAKPDGQVKSTSSGFAAAGPAPATYTNSAVPAPSMLRGKTVEDIVNRWSADLETQARAFSQFASEVAVWDRTLIENGNYISALYAAVIQAESTQASLDQTLEHVEQQQRQLISTLDQYEKTASEILHGSGGIMASTEGLGLADSERDKSYALAANLYTQLDDLSNSLTQMVEAVNGLNVSSAPKASGEDSNEDPISTIAGILNAHLSSLQWIDSYLRDMETKVKDAERKIHEVVNRRGSDGFSKVRSFGLSSSRR